MKRNVTLLVLHLRPPKLNLNLLCVADEIQEMCNAPNKRAHRLIKVHTFKA